MAKRNSHITQIHAFVVVDPDDGRERIAAGLIQGQTRSLVAGNPRELLEMEVAAAELVKLGAHVRQVKFVARQEVREWPRTLPINKS